MAIKALSLLGVLTNRFRFAFLKMILSVLLTGLMTALVLTGVGMSQEIMGVGEFSESEIGKSIPVGWKALYFKNISRHTEYLIVRENGSAVVKAKAEGSASGLIREVNINPKEYPVIRWKWKVKNILKKGNANRKDGDDYPARLYVTFRYDPEKAGLVEKSKYEAVRILYGQYPPHSAVNYIWESRIPAGTVLPNAYSNRAMMIVVESGAEKVNQWIEEKRDVYADYRQAFGQEPPMISGVAIMTDTDNTGETAIAYFGNIRFEKK
jgi:hypothetical protein